MKRDTIREEKLERNIYFVFFIHFFKMFSSKRDCPCDKIERKREVSMETKRNDMLKLIAIITMTIDHVGMILFPTQILFRYIGRLAFPIYAYSAACGIVYTKNVKKYLLRLLGIALLSQPIYYFVVHRAWLLNPLFTIFYGILTIFLWEQKKPLLKGLGAVLLVACCYLPQLDYGWYGIFTIFIFYQVGKNRKLCFLMQGMLQVFYCTTLFALPQALSLLAIPLFYVEFPIKMTLPKWFFYFYYPFHLLVIYGVLLWTRCFLA